MTLAHKGTQCLAARVSPVDRTEWSHNTDGHFYCLIFRLGARDSVYYTSLRKHEFFRGINFESLPEMTPPSVGMLPELPDGPNPCWKRCLDAKPGAERIPFLVISFEAITFIFIYNSGDMNSKHSNSKLI